MAERGGALEDLDLSRLFEGGYRGRRVLVTGHTGFKGSWLACWLGRMGARVSGLALDPDTEPSHFSLLGLSLEHDARVDLRDAGAVARVLARVQPEVVFHLAAQPLVREGYRDPAATFASNVTGLVNLFEAVRGTPCVRAVVNATTDKVYEEASAGTPYREDDPLGGVDPYSASKACAEVVSACYRRSYFASAIDGADVRLATARAGNVIGGGDWARDRLVPDLVRAAVADQPLLLRHPAATRPWQHVLEPLSGYLRLAQALLADPAVQGAWNFGPSPQSSLPVATLVARLRAHWPALRDSLAPGPHPHEAAQLALDCSKAHALLGWRPVWDADTTIARTASWYARFLASGEVASNADLDAYVGDARALGLAWAA